MQTLQELENVQTIIKSAIHENQKRLWLVGQWEKRGLSWKVAIAPLKQKILAEIKADTIDLAEVERDISDKQKPLLNE